MSSKVNSNFSSKPKASATSKGRKVFVGRSAACGKNTDIGTTWGC